MVTPSVMEVEVSSLTLARAVSRILTGKLQGQLPVHVIPQAKNAYDFEYIQTRNQEQQKQPPHNNRPKRLMLQASSYLSKGQSPPFF